MPKTALITGVTGQGGAFLAWYLLKKGYIVQGIKRKASLFYTDRLGPKYFRPTEVDLFVGDPTKSMTKLGWQPEYDLKGLIKDMMQSDVKLFKQDEYLRKGGFRTLNYFE